MCKGLASNKVLYEMLLTKIFSYDFSSTKILLRLKASILIISSK